MSWYRIRELTDAELTEAIGAARWYRKHLFRTLQRKRAGGEVDENWPECRAYDRACTDLAELELAAQTRAQPREPDYAAQRLADAAQAAIDRRLMLRVLFGFGIVIGTAAFLIHWLVTPGCDFRSAMLSLLCLSIWFGGFCTAYVIGRAATPALEALDRWTYPNRGRWADGRQSEVRKGIVMAIPVLFFFALMVVVMGVGEEATTGRCLFRL